MKTVSENFVNERVHHWRRLHRIIAEIRKYSYTALSEPDVREFASLFRQVCADLATARAQLLSPDVIRYLNRVVAQAYLLMYSSRPLSKSKIAVFFSRRLPRTILENRRFVLIAALLFLVPFFSTILIIRNRPEMAGRLIPSAFLEQMADSYREGISNGRSMGMGLFAVSFYIQHNVTIAFSSFAGGILLGLGAVFFLIYNGLFLGTISGYILSLGYGVHFRNFVIAHTVFELSGLILAGAAGLLLGNTILKATRFSRKDQLEISRLPIFKMVFAAFILIAFAAVIEGTISPQPFPYSAKVIVASVSLLLLIFYFFILPRRIRHKE